ncbi:MAG: hypothetical protein RLZZ253_41 [Verrucomicrobiota bacterium]
MAGNDPFHEREAHSAARELFLGVQPLEHVKELVRMAHIKSGPVVGHGVYGAAGAGLSPDLDPGLGLVSGELDRIFKKVRPDLPDHGGGAKRRGKRVEVELDFAFRMAGEQFRKHVSGHLFHVDPDRHNLLSAHSGELQQIVDQMPHPAGLAHDDFQEPAPVRVQLGPMFRGKDF